MCVYVLLLFCSNFVFYCLVDVGFILLYDCVILEIVFCRINSWVVKILWEVIIYVNDIFKKVEVSFNIILDDFYGGLFLGVLFVVWFFLVILGILIVEYNVSDMSLILNLGVVGLV